MPFVLKALAGDEVLLRIAHDISDDELRQLMAEGISIRIQDLHRSHTHLAIEAPQAVSIDWSEAPEQPTQTSTSKCGSVGAGPVIVPSAM